MKRGFKLAEPVGTVSPRRLAFGLGLARSGPVDGGADSCIAEGRDSSSVVLTHHRHAGGKRVRGRLFGARAPRCAAERNHQGTDIHEEWHDRKAKESATQERCGT